MKKFLLTIPKIFWAILCYLVSITLALVSGFFTFKFYTDGSIEYDFYAMGMMSISLEFIKLMFSAGYPFMRNKHKKNENIVLLIMKISFILSILASLYYLLLGKDLTLSPASKTIEMLYQYMPFLNIVNFEFSQFLGTISLTILIEFLIVFLPTIAPIMFYSKYSNHKTYKISNIDKLKEVLTTIPENLINKLHRKIVIENRHEKLNEVDSSKIVPDKGFKNKKNTTNDKKLITPLTLVPDKDTKELTSTTEMNNNSRNRNSSKFAQNWVSEGWKNTDKKDVLRSIYKLKNNNVCPSVAQLVRATQLKKNKIYEIKSEFENLGIITTKEKQTFVLIDTYRNALKTVRGGGVYYESK